MSFQIINLADHINAGIDKINENFELASWVVDSDAIRNVFNSYINSDTINNYIDQSTFINIIDSDYIQSIIFNTEIQGQIDSGQIYDIIAETGIVSRIDSVEGGFILLAQDFTNLSTSYNDLNTGLSALATANSSLTAQISVLDSGIEVLAQDLVDLQAEFTGSIDIDSATIVEAVGGAISTLETRINANSDEISVVSQSVTDLSADLSLLDSNLTPLIQANATAISNLVAAASATDSGIEVLSGRFDSFQVSLQQALDSGLEVDPEDVANAVGGITDDLYARIHANSDSITVVTADITTLNSKLTLLDSNGALFDVIATADQTLRSEVIRRDSDNLVQAISEFNTALESYIDEDALSTADQNLRTYVRQQDSDNLVQAISEFNTALSSYVTGAAAATADQALRTFVTQGDTATLASARSEFTTALSTYVDSSQFATATEELYTAIGEAGTEVGYTLNLNANNHVAGIEFNNDGATADMVIIADKFGIVNASNNAVKPFTVDGDQVLLSNATVTGQLNISSTGNNGSMTMTNDVMNIFDGSGNLRVKFGRLTA